MPTARFQTQTESLVAHRQREHVDAGAPTELNHVRQDSLASGFRKVVLLGAKNVMELVHEHSKTFATVECKHVFAILNSEPITDTQHATLMQTLTSTILGVHPEQHPFSTRVVEPVVVTVDPVLGEALLFLSIQPTTKKATWALKCYRIPHRELFGKSEHLSRHLGACGPIMGEDINTDSALDRPILPKIV